MSHDSRGARADACATVHQASQQLLDRGYRRSEGCGVASTRVSSAYVEASIRRSLDVRPAVPNNRRTEARR